MFHHIWKYSYIFTSNLKQEIDRNTVYWFSHYGDQKAIESCMEVRSPNMTVCSQLHIHSVSLLQLQEHCVSSIISCVRVWLVIVGGDHLQPILVEKQLSLTRSSSMIVDRKVINTCNRCSKYTCGKNKVMVTFNCLLLVTTEKSNHKLLASPQFSLFSWTALQQTKPKMSSQFS